MLPSEVGRYTVPSEPSAGADLTVGPVCTVHLTLPSDVTANNCPPAVPTYTVPSEPTVGEAITRVAPISTVQSVCGSGPEEAVFSAYRVALPCPLKPPAL